MKIAPSTAPRRCFIIGLLLFVSAIPCAMARDSIEKRGDALAVLIPAIGLGSTLFYEDGYDGTLQFAKAFATSQLTTEVLKRVTHKERPNGACCKSFPSGHASAAFMGAAFIHERYGWQYGLPAYVGAAYVGFTRVHADKHYWVDVGAGAAIGVASSFYFTQPYHGLTVTPVADGDTLGIQVSKRW